MGHKHAQHMAAYALDAADTDRPWDRWEMRYHGGKWSPLTGHPSWTVTAEFRRKPKSAECWLVIEADGSIAGCFNDQRDAESVTKFCAACRVAHMREVE